MAKILGPNRIARDETLGHLFPLEKPEIATSALQDALQEIALARPTR